MASRISSKNKEKRPKGKIVLKKKKKKTENRKQRRRESNPVYLHVEATT